MLRLHTHADQIVGTLLNVKNVVKQNDRSGRKWHTVLQMLRSLQRFYFFNVRASRLHVIEDWLEIYCIAALYVQLALCTVWMQNLGSRGVSCGHKHQTSGRQTTGKNNICGVSFVGQNCVHCQAVLKGLLRIFSLSNWHNKPVKRLGKEALINVVAPSTGRGVF